jgi:hypothetical protein
MDHGHPRIEDNESAFDVDAERGRGVPAPFDADFVEFGGEAFRGLRPCTRYKDRPSGLLVCARDTLQRRALPGPCLPDHDNEPLVRTGDPDRSLLLTRKLTAALRNPSLEKPHLGGHERWTDRLAANLRELADAPQRLALERTMHRGRLPAIRKIEHAGLLVQSRERRQPSLRPEISRGLERDGACLAWRERRI